MEVRPRLELQPEVEVLLEVGWFNWRLEVQLEVEVQPDLYQTSYIVTYIYFRLTGHLFNHTGEPVLTTCPEVAK